MLCRELCARASGPQSTRRFPKPFREEAEVEYFECQSKLPILELRCWNYFALRSEFWKSNDINRRKQGPISGQSGIDGAQPGLKLLSSPFSTGSVALCFVNRYCLTSKLLKRLNN